MGDTFHFDSDYAKQYGISEAVILQNIIFWVKKNKANNKHFHDGKYWTYNSVKAFNELFDFMTKDQVRRTLERLEIKYSAIITGNYNKFSYDKTTWYTLADELYVKHIDNSHVAKMPKGESVDNSHVAKMPNGSGKIAKSDVAKMPNGDGEIAKPIPDIKPDLKNTDIKHTQGVELSFQIESILGEKIGKKKLESLIKECGIERISQYLGIWSKYSPFALKGQSNYFIHVVENDLPVPQPKANNSNYNGKETFREFDQREYEEKDFDRFYANLND